MKSLSLFLLIPLTSGCAEKEAADPHEILAEEYERAEPEDEPPGDTRGLEPATRADCQAAVERIHGIAGAETNADESVKGAVDECLARGTSRREARCIAAIRSEAEIDGCAD